VEIVEARSARGNGIDVRCLDDGMIVTTQPVGALLIGNNEKKVRLLCHVFVSPHACQATLSPAARRVAIELTACAADFFLCYRQLFRRCRSLTSDSWILILVGPADNAD